jgi:D-alanine-D-alanine ligase
MKKVLIIFGGKSGEHEVSVNSARSIEKFIDRTLFETYCLGVTPDGFWQYGQTVDEVTDGKKVKAAGYALTLPSSDQPHGLSITTPQGTHHIECDIVFPIIHGTNGEDGTLQGLLELTNLPYVGSGVLGSAMAMDKVVQKTVCAQHGMPQVKFVWLEKLEWEQDTQGVLNQVSQDLKLPFFVKPANLGSSVGITKVKTPDELRAAIEAAFKFDTKILVEEGVEDILEVEVGILGNENAQASVCGSLKPNTEFYDYQTKYITDDIQMEIPARIPETVSAAIRQTATKAFEVLNCSGLSRVDFFYQPATQTYFLSEVNTLPGFTSISMYPKLWEATGVSYTDLITQLLDLAVKKWDTKQKLSFALPA